MIAYTKDWLENFSIRKTSATWLKKGIITDAENDSIKERHATEYKAQNIFARIGLFLFAVFIVLCSLGIMLLMDLNVGTTGFGIDCLMLSGIFYGLAEYLIRSRNHFRSGVVEGWLYSSLVGLCIALIIFIDNGHEILERDPLIYFIAFTPFVLFASIRFIDAFLTLVLYSMVLIINALFVLKLHEFGKMILPFECMLFSGVIYYRVKKQQPKTGLRYWKNCLWMIEFASITTLYLAGNYMVVRKLTEALLHTEIGAGEDIHFAFLFYAYTILVPLAYIWIGLKRKNRLFIRLGVLLVAAGVLSIRYYHSFMPVETALILSGGLLITVAWFSIRYLKTSRHGITSQADDSTSTLDTISNIAFSELVVNQQAPPEHNNDVDFGGGQFGGGGAGSDF